MGVFAIIHPFFILAWITFLLYIMYMEKEKVLKVISNK